MIVLTDKDHNVVIRNILRADALSLLADVYKDDGLASMVLKNVERFGMPVPIIDARIIRRHFPKLEVGGDGCSLPTNGRYFLDISSDER